MKILSRYVLKEHLAPFLFAFLTITFLLLIDYIPKVVNHVIDKNLPVGIVFELLALNLAWMLALSVPMSVLVATLMAFGRMMSDFEITAMKASGINLLRVLMPLLMAAGVVTVGMIGFNDKILPDLNKSARLLMADVRAMRPTLVFRSGVFISDIPGYLVHLEKIDHATSEVSGVRITDTKNAQKPRIIVADHGYLEMTDGGNTMLFTLYDGELHTLDMTDTEKYRRIAFSEQVISIPVGGQELQRSDSEYRTDREMGLSQMQEQVDRALGAKKPFRDKIRTVLARKIDYLFSDSFSYNYSDTINDAAALRLVQSDASALVSQVDRHAKQVLGQQRTVDKFALEIHKKYSIPAASMAFILIGAPLGILSRRGGMGVAISISIGLFVIYWAFLMAGEDLSDRGIVEPFWAMWSANFLIGGIGIYLLYLVVTEKQFFSFFRDNTKYLARHDKTDR
ncbi:MAG: LptF/LptG family permease [Candidatus Zixiibacteriota bacterium]